MKYDFKNLAHREILRLMGFSDATINNAIEATFSKEAQVREANFYSNGTTITFSEKCFKQIPEYKPDEWNPYPAIQPPYKEAKYLVSYKNGSMDVNWWYPDALAWQDLNGLVVAFRALPEAYKPEPPKDMHPDAIAARRYMGEEE